MREADVNIDRPAPNDRACSRRSKPLAWLTLGAPLSALFTVGCGIPGSLTPSVGLSQRLNLLMRGPTYSFGRGVSVDHVWTEIGLPEAPGRHRVHLENANVYIAFDCDWGHAQWVSWSVTAQDFGRVKRSNEFHQESRLPAGCLSPEPDDYKGSGYDRGHMAPSGDRTSSKPGNLDVFSMANIVPQAPQVNQMAWNEFENLTRAYVHRGDEAIVFAGTAGSLGKIAPRGINIPEYTWRVVVVIPHEVSSDDWYRAEDGIQVFATIFSNELKGRSEALNEALVSVDEVEALAGIDLLEGLEDSSENNLERRVHTPNPF